MNQIESFATKSPIRHVAIAGNIGAGKTTLSELLARRFGWDVHYENTESNPYLSDFYMEMKRWSFNLQVFFLSSRYQQVLQTRPDDLRGRLYFCSQPSGYGTNGTPRF